MRIVTQVTLAGQQVYIVAYDPSQLAHTSLEQRVLSVSESLRAYEIVVCEVSLADFLAEEQADDRARLRKLLLDANVELIHPAQMLADSIEDVGVLIVTKAPHFLKCVELVSPAMVFVPSTFLGHLDLSGGQLESIRSKPWKANTIDVFELEDRFSEGLKAWRFYDSSRLKSRRQGAGPVLSEALGLEQDLARVEREYMYAHAIGSAVGHEHANQWLAMDLKLEHFLPLQNGKISHVDHGDDVFLLRQPTAEECAKSIAPLYQQMNYPQWHAFREGYWDMRRRQALDVLLIFEDARIGEILGCRSVANAVQARNEGDTQAAVAWCEGAEAAFRAYQEIDEAASWLYLRRVQLVQGDVYFYNESFTEALAVYESALALLRERKGRGMPENREMMSGMINSAAALQALSRNEEARERLLQAKRLGESLPPEDDPRVRFLLDTTSRNIESLEQLMRKAAKR